MYLNCHSYHSLRYGTIPIPVLVSQAKACGVTALALTDINTVTGIYEFMKACEKEGIKPVMGMEFRCQSRLKYIGLARNNAGLAAMNRFRTDHNFDGTPLPDLAPDFNDVFIIYAFENAPEVLRAHEFVGIAPNELSKLYLSPWRNRLEKLVVLQSVTFYFQPVPDDYGNFTPTYTFGLHKVMRAIDNNILLTKLTAADCGKASDMMVMESDLKAKYADFPQIIANTQYLLDHCNFIFDFDSKKNKIYFTGSKENDDALLRKLTYEKLPERYAIDNAMACERIEKELGIISQMGFSGYILITHDIVAYSQSRGFLHIGRGSGANSIIAYCLGITDICPIELDLYFERFLNLNRKAPPDFDIDWSWKERDTILEYIFEKYGKDHVAFCGTNVEFKYRSIFREIGKVFGLPKEELDRLAKNPLIEHDSNKVVKAVQHYGKMLDKYPNQRSMHSCGILISEEPITNYTVLEMPPKGFPIVLFDMHVAEDIGFDKFDILSQRGIGHIDDSVKIIRRNRGINVDIRNTAISKNEARCNDFLGRGQTIGCFYIESPAMRGLLRRLKCDNYKVLVAASSIIRPGVAQSGMMKEYIFRHNYPGQFEYFHEVFEQQLGETYGIMVYQEDVIKIALHYGGLPAADGDILRRAMSGKGRSKEALQKVKDNFFACCAEKGHPLALSQEIYRQIESFAGYSFCKAHSASYAVESYQSLYLKVHYPIEFMVAVINNQGGFYRTEVYVHEARMSGAAIHNPCVNKSDYETTVYGSDLYLGLMHLEGLETRMAHRMVSEREANGDYLSLEDFVNRIPIGIEGLQILIFIGAFRFTGKAKNQLLVSARLLLVNFKPENREWLLLREPMKPFHLPQLQRSGFEDAFDEIELLGFPVSRSPFDLLQTRFRGDVLAKDLNAHHKKTVRLLAYLISRKHVPTKMGDMFFGTWIDAEGAFFDTAHFADCLRQYPFQGGGCYLLLGHVEVDYHFPTVTITKMAKMPFIPDPRYSNSDQRQFRAHQQIREDVSMTSRSPYPQEQEINLPRHKMKT